MGEITQRYAPSVLQAELLKAIAQRVPGDAEAVSGLGWVSGRLAHRSLDHRLFPLSEVDALRRQGGRASVRLRRRRAMVGARQREMLHVQPRTAAPQHRALDHVAELADVAGPRIRQQQLTRRRADFPHRLPVLGIEDPQEVVGEEQHVLPALAQRRHDRSEEHTSELQSRLHLVCRLLLEKKKTQRSACALRASLSLSLPYVQTSA